MFQGFSQQAVDFLWGIRFNNERSWFLEHKQEYLTYVAEPLRQLGEEVQQVMEEKSPELGLNLHVSRIYRDARRLHGRGPYKDHLWFTLRRPKERWVSLPAFYFEIAPEYYSFGMGCYDPTPVTMAKLRARIDRDPKPLEKLVRAFHRQDVFTLEGEVYKRPKGDPGKLLSPWYNKRGFSLSCARKHDSLIFSHDLADILLEGYEQLLPFYRYLMSLEGDPAPGHNS